MVYPSNYQKLALVLPFALFTHAALAFPKIDPVPGGIITIPFESTGSPKAYYRGNRVILTPISSKKWMATIGIPLSVLPGEEHFVVEQKGGKTTLPFTVQPRTYPSQHIALSDQKQVKPDAKTLKRIAKENIEIENVFRTWREEKNRKPYLLTLPVSGKISGPFGFRRFFNGEARNPHSGIDIASPLNTAVHAPAKAKVLKTGNYFFNGKTLFLDHGQGLITMYCHLNKILVRRGQTVRQGQIIALVGQTGRATGPHLHWSVSLNNARVNPTLFLE